MSGNVQSKHTKRTAAMAAEKAEKKAKKASCDYESFIDQYEGELSDLFDQFHALLIVSGLPMPHPKDHAPREFAQMVFDSYVSPFSVVDDEDSVEYDDDCDSNGEPIAGAECEESTAESTDDGGDDGVSSTFDEELLESDDPSDFNDDSDDDDEDGDVNESDVEEGEVVYYANAEDDEEDDDETAIESKE